ncbi:ORF21 protein [Purpureocillium lavendulum]|uniref:ORF21 protein n=1 Tax=Purpureocillium lavendulum TaxID=1247861 RepID=A0AB34FVU6_9HYPO|nr:ORF21 protein [Purpureocillium lavendulum]
MRIYQPVARDLTEWGAKAEQQWIVNAIIQELDISTGRLLFEWASLDHVSPDEAILPINPGQAGSGYNSSDAWDYFHINSVDKDADGNYLISARDACAVHKINGTDGSIIWRLNGNRSDFKMANGTKFCFQHHARWLEQDGDIEIISLYDNSAHGTEHSGGSEVHTAPTSSGKILKLNTTSWTAELVGSYFPPDDLLSKSQGSTQVLPNGNVLVGWGSEGAVTEFTSDGQPIFHAYMDSGSLGTGVENYRAFRYNWTGLPSEDPAIAALENEDGTTVYVSWNGDTETVAWRFYAATDDLGSRELLGEVPRTSFETSLWVPKKLTGVTAESVDVLGKTLVATAIVNTEQEILPGGGGKHQASKPSASDKVKQKPIANWRPRGGPGEL